MAADSEYLRLAAKSSPIALTVIDPAGNCTLLEGGGVAAIPMEFRPVIGESVFHPSANPAFIDAVRRGLQGESVTQTFGSNDRQFEVLCSPLLDDNDSVCGVTAFLLDVTGRHDADATAVRAHRLETLSSMTVTNSALTDAAGLNDMLGRLAERAKVLVQADYAALSIFADGGRLERFIYTGMPAEVAQRLGSPPVGRGLLGALPGNDRPLRLRDLTQHERFTGWPEGHPDMRAFLGVPIVAAGETIGSFYMTRIAGAPPFDDLDEFAAAMLAMETAVAVSNAIVYERSSRMSMLEERVVIAQDLHDGTIQSLYALGLELDLVAGDERATAEQLRETMKSGIAGIGEIISDIRGYIHALESAEPAESPELGRDLGHIARQLVPPGIDVILNITAPALNELTPRAATDLLFIAREAVSNAVRHGSPTKIAIDLRQTSGEIALTIQDNGAGYDQFNARSGLGTITMRSRAERLGAQLTSLSLPGMGTTVRVAVPLAESE